MLAGNYIRPTFVMLVAYLAALVAMLLSVLMFPAVAPIQPTSDVAFISPR